MMLRRRSGAASPEEELERVTAFVAGRIRIRFTVSPAQLAARIVELAAAAGATPWDQANRVVLDDLYMATACAAGDIAAWGECEAAHFPFIRTFARRFLPDAAAQDLADQVIADLWQRGKIGRYEGRSTLRTWLGAVVAHAAINARKTWQPGVTPDTSSYREYARRTSDAAVTQPAPEEAHAGRALADLIVRAIEGLNADEKLLLQMHYEQGLTLDEMEVPLGSSKATLSRRLKRIREQLMVRIDELAERKHGTSVTALRDRVSLDRLEFDLSVLLRVGVPVEGKGPDRV